LAFVAGSTAGVTTVEFEPGLVRDIHEFFERLIPEQRDYFHHATWGDDNGSSHLRAAPLKPSLTIPFRDGQLMTGTWQQIVPVHEPCSKILRRPVGLDERADLSVLGNFVSGAFTPVLYKHSKNLDLVDVISVGVDKMQRNFDPLKQQIDTWKTGTLIDDQAKVIIYEAFVEQRLPTRLLPWVHQNYFEPTYEAFAPRTLWSLSNAFTSAFKKLTPVRQFQLTAKLGTYLQNC